MRANVDQRISLKLFANPKVERNIGMTRCAAKVVIIIVPRRKVSAFGLQRDDGIPNSDRRKLKGAVDKLDIVFWLAPRLN